MPINPKKNHDTILSMSLKTHLKYNGFIHSHLSHQEKAKKMRSTNFHAVFLAFQILHIVAAFLY